MSESDERSEIIDEMLSTAKTIAVVGMSDKTWRASHNIGRYLAENGYRVFPVNPALKEILGKPCYPDLDAAQAAAQRTHRRRHRSCRRLSRLGECAAHRRRRDPARAFPISGCRTRSSTTKPSPAPAPPASNASRTTAFFANTPNGPNYIAASRRARCRLLPPTAPAPRPVN